MVHSFVTGAGGGIGRAVVEALLDRGDTVTAADLVLPTGDYRSELCAVELDVRDSAQVAEVVHASWNSFGPIDNLINVAGVLRSGMLDQTTDDQWRDLMEVNAFGVFSLCRAVGPLMAQLGSGTITTVASNAAIVPRAGMAAYAASKAAASSLTRSLGLELGPYGVRCNVVCPGSTLTPMITDIGSENGLVAGRPEMFKAGIPLGRIAQPEDIASVVVFLTSAAARQMTLQEVVVDGGASQH